MPSHKDFISNYYLFHMLFRIKPNSFIMKKLTVLIITLLILSITSVYSQESDKLEGVWKLIYHKHVTPDTSIEHSQFVNSSLKYLLRSIFHLVH
jgi:hypothetical protein